jgi:hypothetical protein
VQDAIYLAVFVNKSTSCHPEVYRRTPQGLQPEALGRLPLLVEQPPPY